VVSFSSASRRCASPAAGAGCGCHLPDCAVGYPAAGRVIAGGGHEASVVDFGRSYLIFRTTGGRRTPRLQLDVTCTRLTCPRIGEHAYLDTGLICADDGGAGATTDDPFFGRA
jgi:hypothetical protein